MAKRHDAIHPAPTSALVSAVKSDTVDLPKVGRAIHVKTPGLLHFIDVEGVTQSRDAGYWVAGAVYGCYQIKRILADSDIVAAVLY